ncbi:cbb3-type cytochrome c oxidase subunit I [Litorilinea aerophila]|uniref:cytochrome c oxidase subunit I n=1 Tax=Litorilinea aerophila TaxID=1204385 RepID=UPI001E28B175|nr:cbb3-type cytochrome c oxidase subunit I [Litorilinea aerophila]MCC9075238.1 cbb3-type cytochrome c oxidase subunit I [Litorilinea aerophila]
MSLLSLGIVRGLIGQLVGTAGGMALTMLIRLMLGLPAWKEEPVWVVGLILGGIGFLIGVGAVSDWFKWMKGIETPLHHGPPADKPAWTRYFGVDYNHKVIGIQYAVTGLVMLIIGGSFAVIFRTELARSGLQFLTANQFNSFLGMHGWAALFGIFISIGGMANYLVPLMLGAEDMAFPRLNAFAYWLNVPAIVMLLGAVYFGWDAGWTVYPPLSTKGPVGFQFLFYAVFFLGMSSILGSLNLLVTIFRMRPPGMSLFRMPIFCWAIVATSLIQLTATQLIGMSFLMLSVERVLGMGFFDPAKGGTPILFQHLFWFYSHPAVYVWVLPGLGIISEILPVFSRKPLFGYRWIALSSVAIALVGFLVWGHHMFVSGYSDYLRVPFMISTMLVAVPTGVKFFSWLGTIWGGKISFPTPMLFVLGAISVFLIGGLSGPILATVPTDLHLHDSYFVVGHFHATIFGGFVFPFFAAIYYWYPKITGRMYDERLGKLHFWIMTPGFWLQSIGQMSVGVMGMRRRIADYDPALGIEPGHILITIAGFAIAFSILLMIYNLFHSADVGELAGANPWRSRSPEWQIPSPVPEHSYASPITVVGEPYDYGLAGSTYIRMAPASAGHD